MPGLDRARFELVSTWFQSADCGLKLFQSGLFAGNTRGGKVGRLSCKKHGWKSIRKKSNIIG